MIEPNKLDPSPKDWLDLLAGLRELVKTGQVAAINFAIVDPRYPGKTMIDSYGSPEMIEMAGRIAVERIAASVDLVDSSMARAIREAMPKPSASH